MDTRALMMVHPADATAMADDVRIARAGMQKRQARNTSGRCPWKPGMRCQKSAGCELTKGQACSKFLHRRYNQVECCDNCRQNGTPLCRFRCWRKETTSISPQSHRGHGGS
jgi:hypothetical protein